LSSLLGPRPRDLALDGLRTIAVLLMIGSHTSRLIIWDARREWCRLVLLIEPLTASLFLILVGASLVYSWRAKGPLKRLSWYRQQSLRAIVLWVISCVFYMLEDGFYWPDAVSMSGILATIAYTIIMGMVLVSLRRPALFLIIAVLALAALHFSLDRSQTYLFALNAGNSPLLPLFLFACLGALGAMVLESPWRWLRPAVITCALLSLAFILNRHSITEVFSKPLGRYETARILISGTEEARVEKSIPYYNLRPILVPVIASLTILLYALLLALRPLWNRVARFTFPLGRNSLHVYILHLTLLASLIVMGGIRPLKKTWQGDTVLVTVILISYGWATGKEAWSARRKKSTEKV
jgi:uncharacterized membrane protein